MFENVCAGSGICLQYHPAPTAIYQPNGGWTPERDTVYVVFECLKLILYWVKYLDYLKNRLLITLTKLRQNLIEKVGDNLRCISVCLRASHAG